MTRTWLRWAPAVVAPALIAGAVLAAPFQAGAGASLAPKSPEEVLVLLAGSEAPALSGTLTQTSELGLPQLDIKPSSAGTAGAADGLHLLTGTHTARVYLDGPERARLQVMDDLGERDIVRNGDDVWQYTFDTNTAIHLTLPDQEDADRSRLDGVPTPAGLASRFLAAVDDSTEVSVGDADSIAGRASYTLVLTPRSPDTLVGSVSIAVDAETGLPLSVNITARGQGKPAFALAFTQLTMGAPDPARFEFEPPAGATVREKTVPQQLPEHDVPPSDLRSLGGSGATPGVTVVGSGWNTVLGRPVGDGAAELRASPLLSQLTEPVPGGRLLSTSLVSVLLTDDGRVFAGSVPPSLLHDAAAADDK